MLKFRQKNNFKQKTGFVVIETPVDYACNSRQVVFHTFEPQNLLFVAYQPYWLHVDKSWYVCLKIKMFLLFTMQFLLLFINIVHIWFELSQLVNLYRTTRSVHKEITLYLFILYILVDAWAMQIYWHLFHMKPCNILFNSIVKEKVKHMGMFEKQY